MTYREAGVDLEAAGRATDLIRARARAAVRPEVLGDIGGFAGAFAPRLAGLAEPVLVASADGVGTKVTIARAMGRHDTIGIDLVAMVVDDLVCLGAEPLFLLDYVACGRLVPERIAAIVEGVAEGCRQAGCALLGGETAEHPGLMDPDDYDLAGFGVGVVERPRMLSPERVRAGDAVIGLASSGLHANGYSLVRKLLLDRDLSLDAEVPELGTTLGEELLRPTRIYAPAVLALASTSEARAAAHVTGGGLPGNLRRALPPGLEAVVRASAWPEPPVFAFLRGAGGVEEAEMRRVFNCGVGMVLLVGGPGADRAVRALAERGERAFIIGEVREGDRSVVIER